MDRDALDRARGGPFLFRKHGLVYELPSPADLPWQVVCEAVSHWALFARHVVGDDGTLSLPDVRHLAGAWATHFDLPDGWSAHRLSVLVGKYGAAIEVDLRSGRYGGVDLGEEWRARRWRRLLNLIDHLPRTSEFMQAVSDDEEYAELAADEGSGKPQPPRLADYSPEREALDAIRDLLAQSVAVAISAAGGKPPKFKPADRPVTAADRARSRAAMRKHESLAARLLGRSEPTS